MHHRSHIPGGFASNRVGGLPPSDGVYIQHRSGGGWGGGCGRHPGYICMQGGLLSLGGMHPGGSAFRGVYIWKIVQTPWMQTSGRSKGALPARAPPLRPKIFAISCSFLENFGKIVGWRPLLEGWRPLLREILDPPLQTPNLEVDPPHPPTPTYKEYYGIRSTRGKYASYWNALL